VGGASAPRKAKAAVVRSDLDILLDEKKGKQKTRGLVEEWRGPLWVVFVGFGFARLTLISRVLWQMVNWNCVAVIG